MGKFTDWEAVLKNGIDDISIRPYEGQDLFMVIIETLDGLYITKKVRGNELIHIVRTVATHDSKIG